ncbi:MAG: carboxy-terminal processing protease [Bdellovibrio sp.]|nr:carboxy-terminal processing protease [Bdellovibrio sp.]
MKRLLAVLFVISCACTAYYFSVHKTFVNPYPIVCDLVAEKIFLDDTQVNKWKRLCHRRSRLVTPYSQKKLVIKDINNVLGLLNVSHLEVYDSSDVKKIWQGESQETGIESEFVDGELVIFKVHPQSPAALVGLKKGDVIESINGQQPNPWEAQSESGQYLIQRGSTKNTYALKTAVIQRSEAITVEKLKNDSALVQVPSFRANFFNEEQMLDLQKNLKGVRHLVVDLRGNSGGNFVAGLRFLSTLICQPEEIGRLIRPRAKQQGLAELPNRLQDEEQLAVLDQHKEVLLKTFANENCYRGDVRVLVDNKTSSVAEMVAQALKEFRKAPLLGGPSRGELLVGVWYPLEEVGRGVRISIPEALYVSHGQHRIENNGVQLDKVLYYDLSEMQSGVDSWVKKALD